MLLRALASAALLALPLAALAESPNLEPGEWEFTSTTTVEGDFPIPDETDTHRECLTQDAIDEANSAFIQEEEGCEFLEQEASSESMSYRMSCQGEGGEAMVVGEMRYFSDRMEGDMQVDTTTPMGDMVMNTSMQGERLGDC
ncbi:DUF3617 domain-containing protein [Halomonas salipaludis]|uniref:DUF3617 family protein n=1 Tax=Halomonas salipaludis TaxID=2032625 RepID=A0A2A2EXU8_9GAMM|nr:DUF3617 family protein [Halomonas salipaludis]PAU77986.1 hypothetical protein CK498_04405 [Halomonas salipaludis]